MQAVGEVAQEVIDDIQLDTGGQEATYIPPEPTKKDIANAEKVLQNLKAKVTTMGDENVISALLQVTDILHGFTAPEAWPEDEEVEYTHSQVVENMVQFLCLGCRRLEMDPAKIVCLWRNKDKWMDGDRPRRGQTTKLDTRMQHLLPGKTMVLEVNFHHFLTMNPLQKIQSIYHLLRERDAEGSKTRPDFVGYMDELELFGLRTFHELLALEYAMRNAQEVEHPHQLPLFSGPEWDS